MPCPMVFASTSKWNFKLCFLLAGSCTRFYLQPSKSSHLAIRKDTNALHPLLLKCSSWASRKPDKRLQTCSLSSSIQMTPGTAAPSYSTSVFPFPSQRHLSKWLTAFFFICLKLTFLFLQSCPLPFFWKCSFQLFHISKWQITTYQH